jgi:hypothetical protein
VSSDGHSLELGVRLAKFLDLRFTHRYDSSTVAMTFIRTAVLTQFEVTLRNETAVIPLGYDDTRPLSYALLIGLEPLPGGDVEHFFCIIETDTQTRIETRFWSGADTRDIFAGVDRKIVLEAVRAGTTQLLGALPHPRIFCCTHDAHLPEKALKKHFFIAEVFKICGYEPKEQPVLLGKKSWWMERAE